MAVHFLTEDFIEHKVPGLLDVVENEVDEGEALDETVPGLPPLTKEQQDIFERLTIATGFPMAFMTGEAGTGKSSLLKHIVQHARQCGFGAICLAPTRAAANNINGQMIYRWFEIRTSYGEMSVPLVNPVAVKMKRQEMVESGMQPVLLIDEVGFCQVYCWSRCH